jgi:hypothetical protein
MRRFFKTNLSFSNVLIIALFLFSCKSSPNIPERFQNLKNLTVIPANAQPVDSIEFNNIAHYHSTKNVLIGRMGGIAVDTSGRVFIPDKQKKTIDVFEPDGRFLTHLGSKGEGPGEFNYISDVQIANDELIAQDPPQQRAVVFSLKSLAYIHTISIANNKKQFKVLNNAFPSGYHAYRNHSFLLKFITNHKQGTHAWDKMEEKSLYYHMDRQGNILNKLFETRDELDAMIPYGGRVTSRNGTTNKIRLIGVHPTFYGKALTAFSHNNHFYWAWSDIFLIKVYNSQGHYQRAFYYPFKRDPLTHKSAVNAGVPKYIMKGWKLMDKPKTWPALQDIKTDDHNRIWVSTIVKNKKIYQWWVLSNDGKILAQFNWPRTKHIEVIKNGSIYTKEENKKGLPEIVRYRFKMK